MRYLLPCTKLLKFLSEQIIYRGKPNINLNMEGQIFWLPNNYFKIFNKFPLFNFVFPIIFKSTNNFKVPTRLHLL